MRRWFRFWQLLKKPHRHTVGYRPATEWLEDRRLLAAPVVDAINSQTVPLGKSLYVPVTASDADNDALTYTVTSSNPQVTAQVRARTTFLRFTVAGFGDMTFQLFDDLTPRTVALISGLVKSKFYDNLTFHRIVQNFVIQGGDPSGDGTGGPGFQFEDEFNAGSIFSGNGQLAMANSGKDTNGSQFFVTVGAQRFLDHNHTIFGQLVRGFDVLDRIRNVPVGENDRPETPVVITRAALFTNIADTVLTVTAATGAGPATITVTAADPGGGTSTQTFQVTPQTDATNDPAILGPVANQVTPAGTPLTFTLTGTDPENDALEFKATLVSSQQATVTVNGNQVTVTPNAGFTGALRLSVGVKQQGATNRGSSQDPFDTQEIIVAVGDQALTAQGVAGTATEGTAAENVSVATFTSGNASATAATFTARINWGDGQQSDGAVTQNGSTFTVAGTHVYKYGGRYPVRATITSTGGFVGTADTTFTVADAALTATAAAQVRGRQNTALNNVTVATFTDANTSSRNTDFTATIDWGDGQTSQGTISASGSGAFSVTGSHTYTIVGDRTVRVTISQVNSNEDVTFNTATANTPAAIKELPSNERIVSQIYLDVLERPADPTGLANWTAKLNQGSTRDEVLLGIQATEEYRRLAVQKLYRRLLKRDGDEAGLAGFANALSLGSIIENVEAVMASSEEYFQTRANQDNSVFLETVYLDTLGRPIDEAARFGFLQQLNAGTSRKAIVDVIFASIEHHQVTVTGYFQQLLRRITDPEGLAYFASVALASGARQEQVVAGICGADEYLDNVRV